MAQEQTRQDELSLDIPEPTLSVEGRPEIAEQARAELPELEAEEQRLLGEVERLRAELVTTEAEFERMKTVAMRARRAAITGEPIGPRESELLE